MKKLFSGGHLIFAAAASVSCLATDLFVPRSAAQSAPVPGIPSGESVAGEVTGIKNDPDGVATTLALEILEVTDARGGLKIEFDSTVDDLVAKLKASGFPGDGIEAVQATLRQWFEREIRWEDIRPRLAEAYVGVFSAGELEALLAFYRTPAGKKAAARLPDLFLKTVAIRQEYAAGKQEILNREIGLVINKYKAR
ncbi:hypothetical protein OpiT1DRAFT_00258 [Opitutaceae bacterium TAV1]|nr:hypothetical protein OpiT1DRAFT_00258 [Opitutaceae bacterium TAV1]